MATPDPAPRDLLLVFQRVQQVTRAERHARKAGLNVDMIPAPRAISSQCGVVLEARQGHSAALRQVLTSADLSPLAVFRLRRGCWLPTALGLNTDEPPMELCSEMRAARGLPPAWGPQPLPASALDALAGEPPCLSGWMTPMLWDGFSFGRIAAVAMLSNLEADGHVAVRARVMVQVPDSHRVEDGTAIIDGAAQALEEAGLLVDPATVLRGDGWRAGIALWVDPEVSQAAQLAPPVPLSVEHVLVLTQPLGTGLIFAQCHNEDTDPAALSTAIRWAATLKSPQLAAIRQVGAAALALVGSEGLVCAARQLLLNARDRTSAPLLSAWLYAEQLYRLTGALDAAFPCARPRPHWLAVEPAVHHRLESLARSAEVAGGYLASCPQPAAEVLCRLLPGARVVGRLGTGPEPGVRLLTAEKPR